MVVAMRASSLAGDFQRSLPDSTRPPVAVFVFLATKEDMHYDKGMHACLFSTHQEDWFRTVSRTHWEDSP
jgi:hypothetical protein